MDATHVCMCMCACARQASPEISASDINAYLKQLNAEVTTFGEMAQSKYNAAEGHRFSRQCKGPATEFGFDFNFQAAAVCAAESREVCRGVCLDRGEVMRVLLICTYVYYIVDLRG